MAQLLSVTVLGGGLALCAYFGGLYPSMPWAQTSADFAERAAEVLVVAWDGLCLDLLSCDDGTATVCREAADDYAGFSRSDGRAGDGDDGFVRVLSG